MLVLSFILLQQRKMQYYANWGIVEGISFVFRLLFLVLNFCNKEKYRQKIIYVVALGINFLIRLLSLLKKKSPLDRIFTTKLNHYFSNVVFFQHLHRFHACHFCLLLLARRVYGRSFKSCPFQCLFMEVQSLGKVCEGQVSASVKGFLRLAQRAPELLLLCLDSL